MSQPIHDAEIDIIVNTDPIQAIEVGEVTNQPVAFDVGEVPNLISNGLPVAGATGQHLAKKSGNDYDTQWVTAHEVIAGGTAGQVLGKKSGTDYDTQWTAPVTIADTATVDLTGDGSAANPLKADVLSVPAGKAAIATSNSPEVTLSGDGGATPLSAALTGTVSGKALNVPDGDVTVGKVGGGLWYLWQKFRDSTREVAFRFGGANILTGIGPAISMYVDGASKATLGLNETGQVFTYMDTGAIIRPIPFATSAGQASIVISTAAVSGSVVVTYPANRFTQAPIVTATCVSSSSWLGLAGGSMTNVQFSAYARNLDNVAGTGTFSVTWIAVQMTPTSTTGPAMTTREGGDFYQHTSTCHTEGCENQDIPITGEAPNGCLGFICGACNIEMTDVITQR